MKIALMIVIMGLFWVMPGLCSDSSPYLDWELRDCVTNCYGQFPPDQRISEFYLCGSHCRRNHQLQEGKLWRVPG